MIFGKIHKILFIEYALYPEFADQFLEMILLNPEILINCSSEAIETALSCISDNLLTPHCIDCIANCVDIICAKNYEWAHKIAELVDKIITENRKE